MAETIFALSSGAPPAAIAIVRVSGPQAAHAMQALLHRQLPARKAVTAAVRDSGGELLDRALALWLPGPQTATGEDTLELHCHGGRAVVQAVEAALAALTGLRRAQPGEFTRRAFANGRIDLAEAEGLVDLLSAETELQRQSALALAGGAFSREVGEWRERLLLLSAAIEAVLDFADEDDVTALPADFVLRLDTLEAEISGWLDRPRAEVLREGFKVVLAGPPNAGKSTLFNALVESEAAITAPIAGTTRDLLMHPVALAGIPFRFFDTAGLTDDTSDVIEAIGVERARAALANADLVLLLSDVDGLYSGDPRTEGAALIPVVEAVTPEVMAMASGASSSGLGSGGMVSKLQAAQIATRAGIALGILNGTHDAPIAHALAAETGTLFLPVRADRARKAWLGGRLAPAGELRVDKGCAEALKGGASLLAAG